MTVRRRPRSLDSRPCAVLYPAIAEAASRLGAQDVGLIDVAGPDGLNLQVDRVAIRYSDGRELGDPSSSVQVSSTVVGSRSLPPRSMPGVVARVSLGRDPIDVRDPADLRWLRACVPPDQADRAIRLEAELALVATAPPLVLRGDVVDLLPEAVDRVPSDALPVVITTWALSELSTKRRRSFLDSLA